MKKKKSNKKKIKKEPKPLINIIYDKCITLPVSDELKKQILSAMEEYGLEKYSEGNSEGYREGNLDGRSSVYDSEKY